MSKKQENPKNQPANAVTRPPVIVVLGHIDHGKTSLLDAIRKTSVAAKETGGITQKIGAYQVVEPTGRRITFIDTPGHEAFSKMRERGAGVADLAVLVVAANDGVKPQTVEAIAHAKAAGGALVVGVNKGELASPQDVAKVKGQLAKEDVVVEDQGGKIPAVAVSATTGAGVPELLEIIGLSADMLELKAETGGEPEAVVIESLLSSQQGPLATLIVKKGTFKIGDQIFAGEASGKIKALMNDLGQRISEAGPGMPVQVLGFSDVPPVGALVTRLSAPTSGVVSPKAVTNQPVNPAAEPTTSLNVVLRADTQGSLEAVEVPLANLEAGGKGINFLLKSIGPISDSDVRLAAAPP